MAFEQAKVNAYNWSEATASDNQITITNSSGRAYTNREIVSEEGYVGEVREYDGIADGATGKINIVHDRIIRTIQADLTDTFVVGQNVYFLAGGSGAAGKLRATPEAGSVPYGVCEGFGGTGGTHTYVEVRPFAQGGEAQLGGAVKVLEVIIPTGSHGAGAPVVSTDIPVGSKIIDVEIRTTVSNASGTATMSNGTNDITDAIIMAVINVMTKAGTIDQAYDTVIAAGLTFTAAATGDAGRAYVYYI